MTLIDVGAGDGRGREAPVPLFYPPNPFPLSQCWKVRGLFNRCIPHDRPVPEDEYRCRCSAELLCNSAAFPDERESAAGQLKSPVWEDKPQSHTPTLRYKYTPNLPDEPLRECGPFFDKSFDLVRGPGHSATGRTGMSVGTSRQTETAILPGKVGPL
jgi:hypothetical protein